MEYKIPLKAEGLKHNHITAMHLFAAFLFIAMGAVAFFTPIVIGVANAQPVDGKINLEYRLANWAGIAYIILGITLLFITIFFNRRIIQSRANLPLRIVEMLALGAVMVYSIYQKWNLPAVYSGTGLVGIFLASYFETRSKVNRFILLDEEGIHIQRTTAAKSVKWQDVNNIIIKNNILTIDCKNNRFYQEQIIPETMGDKNALMNMVAQQIAAHAHLYKEDW